MRLSQYCYFAIHSIVMTAEAMAREIGLPADETKVRGSRSAEPPRPVTHVWRLNALDQNAPLDEQITQLVARLRPVMATLAPLCERLLHDADEGSSAGAVFQVVRQFDDPDGVDEVGAIAPGGFLKLRGQHQLLGWHLDRDVLEFIVSLHADVDVDEYG